jgi:hypothetical protein
MEYFIIDANFPGSIFHIPCMLRGEMMEDSLRETLSKI